MDTGENKKRRFNLPKKKILGWIKETVKDPLTLLLFAVLWLILASPAIFGVIAYWASKEERWLVVSGSWIAFTAPPLPLPITPLSIAGAIALRSVIRKAGVKSKANKEEYAQKRKAEKMRRQAKRDADKELIDDSKLVEIVDIYNTGSISMSDEDFITGVEYVPGMEGKQQTITPSRPEYLNIQEDSYNTGNQEEHQDLSSLNTIQEEKNRQVNSIYTIQEDKNRASNNLIELGNEENREENGRNTIQEDKNRASNNLIELGNEENREGNGRNTIQEEKNRASNNLIEFGNEEKTEENRNLSRFDDSIENSFEEEVKQDTLSRGSFIQYSKNTCDFSRGMNCQR